MRVGIVRTSVMTLVALGMGFGCGVLTVIITDLLRVNPRWADPPNFSTLYIVLVIGWGFATWLLLRRADGVLTVMRRGFLAGMVQWIVVGLLVVFLAGRWRGRPSIAVSWESERGSPDIPTDVDIMKAASMRFATVCLVGLGVVLITERVLRRREDPELSAPPASTRPELRR